MRFFKSDRNGFTMIELLVAIAIISILATVAFGALQEGRKQARDTQRVNDISQIQIALRLYKDGYSAYPAYPLGDVIGDSSGLDTILSTYLANTIKDPFHNATNYQYVYDSDFLCGTVSKKVLYAKTMERVGAGNWATVCGTNSDGTSANTYGVILQ